MSVVELSWPKIHDVLLVVGLAAGAMGLGATAAGLTMAECALPAHVVQAARSSAAASPPIASHSSDVDKAANPSPNSDVSLRGWYAGPWQFGPYETEERSIPDQSD
jgi:hypothetical protein